MMRMHSVFAVLTVLATFSVIVVLRDAGVTRRGGGVGPEEQVVNEREGDKETREEQKRVVSRIETCMSPCYKRVHILRGTRLPISCL